MITIMSQMVKFITFYQVFDDKITGCNNCKNRKRESIFNGHRFDMQISIPKTPSYLWELFSRGHKKGEFPRWSVRDNRVYNNFHFHKFVEYLVN